MEQIYVVMLIAMLILAITDLVVGVSNDAVNFLNSAIGSKAVSFRTIMIVASVGVIVGALFSSGMMEIARSGIFNPAMFTFNDVVVLFTAVMITDIILLDVFNSIGLPTSTTVSIIFELLGASVCLALYNIYLKDESLSVIYEYINTKKATEIVYGIFLSIVLSFTIGAFVQYVSRIIFSFQYQNRIKYFGAIFGGLAITAIIFFILIKGLKNVTFISKELYQLILENQFLILFINFIVFALLSQILILVFKINIFKIIILIGTFALALAFAGNDLVNFIGVPIAAFNSFEIYNSGAYYGTMSALVDNNIVANPYFLALAGIIMVVTIWTSKKARSVIETEVGLARQNEGNERFDANYLSRSVVRSAMYIGNRINYLLPKSIQLKIDKQFIKEEVSSHNDEAPAFDMVRASVNMMVASILIAVGTSLKLPLSTTYVTFMVAMGTSFADRAWDRESAVYRVAGVFNVIGGWFITAIVAFVMAALVAIALKLGKVIAFFAIMITVAILLYRSYKKHIVKENEKAEVAAQLAKEDIATIKEVISESSAQIARVFSKTNELYSDVINNLGLQDLNKLKENKKKIKKLEKNVDDLKGNVYYFIKNLDEASVEGSKFYILILSYLQDIVQSISFIANNSYAHVNNNHKSLKFNQIRDLKLVDSHLKKLLDNLEDNFKNEDFSNFETIIKEKENLLFIISDLIQKQISRIRTNENSLKNSKLYFELLLETNDLLKANINLLNIFLDFDSHVKSKIK